MTARAWSVNQYYLKWVATRVVTEEGAFLKNQVPDDYAGAELEVEVIQRIIFFETGGNFLELRLDDFSDVQDSERNAGVGVTAKSYPKAEGTAVVFEDQELYAAGGPSSELEEWEKVENPNLTEAQKTNVAALYSNYVLQTVEF